MSNTYSWSVFYINLLKMFLVTGGRSAGSDYLDSTEIYDPDLGSWRAGAALPSPRRSLKGGTIANRVLMFGNIDILLRR